MQWLDVNVFGVRTPHRDGHPADPDGKRVTDEQAPAVQRFDRDPFVETQFAQPPPLPLAERRPVDGRDGGFGLERKVGKSHLRAIISIVLMTLDASLHRMPTMIGLGMADRIAPAQFKISDVDEPKEDGYDAWKREKILRAIEESRDIETLMTADQVWKKLGLES